MECTNGGGGVSILMLPWLAHGHISPFLELAKKLSRKNFTTYICSTAINLESIKHKITRNYSQSIKLVELQLPSLPNLPPHYHTTNGLPFHLMPTLKDAFEMSLPNFADILTTLKPDLLLYDYNQPWAAECASSNGVVPVMFLVSSAIFTSFGMVVLKTRGLENFPFPEIDVHDHGVAKLYDIALATGFREGKYVAEAVEKSSEFVLIKSSRDIEGKFMDYFSEISNKRLVPTGPLVQEVLDGAEENIEILDWLGKKENSSVVYVSFGSEYFLSDDERRETAKGLELSNVNFIWVVRFPEGEKTELKDALPDGFLDRVGERGKVVEKWAPQAKILKHKSTGGFVSHCGWSSVLESIHFGVPIVAMPMHIDQPLNAKLVSDVGVGFEVARDESGKFRGEKIADAIKKTVLGKDGEKVRKKVTELSENIRNRGEEEMDGVANELMQLCHK